jgi:hypothetical protein
VWWERGLTLVALSYPACFHDCSIAITAVSSQTLTLHQQSHMAVVAAAAHHTAPLAPLAAHLSQLLLDGLA